MKEGADAVSVFSSSLKTAARSAQTASRGFATSSVRASYEDTIKNILISASIILDIDCHCCQQGRG